MYLIIIYYTVFSFVVNFQKKSAQTTDEDTCNTPKNCRENTLVVLSYFRSTDDGERERLKKLNYNYLKQNIQ